MGDSILAAESKPAQKALITLQDSAFGGLAGLKSNEKPEVHAQFKKEKAKTNKILMNEQNWQLA